MSAQEFLPAGSGEHARAATAIDHAPPTANEHAALFIETRLEQRLANAGIPWSQGGDGLRFTIQGMLGAGATGRVLEVHDSDLDRGLVVKVMSAEASANTDDVGSFVEEARITASLTHPNVLPIHEIDVTAQGHPYFAMPQVVGRTLGSAIALSSPVDRDDKIRTPNQIVSAIIAIGQAVAYANHRGIIHQDIKPDNILLGDFGEALLLDWGSASRWPSTSAKLYGTPLYMSPEQARGETATPVSDVYCLGATLFHALTLRLPIWSDDQDEFWKLKRKGIIIPLTDYERSSVPLALAAIALKALASSPAARYPSAAALVADLERYQAGLAVSVHRDPLWHILARWYRKHRLTINLMIVSLALITALGAAYRHEKIKERSDWHLVYRDAFAGGDPSAVDRDWKGLTKGWSEETFHEITPTTSGHWRLDSGRLIASSDETLFDLAFRQRLRGDVRVSWDYTPLRKAQNLNCFLDADERLTGYTFHIGGWGSPSRVVLTRGKDVTKLAEHDEPGLIVVGRTLHFVMEREADRIRLSIDGRQIFEHIEVDDLLTPSGQGFGFDCCVGSEHALANIEVWHRPLPERISPLAVGNQLYQFGDYANAAQIFAEIADSYAGTPLEPQALYRLAMSHVANGTVETGRAVLRRVTEEFPHAECAPLALRARERLAIENGDEQEAQIADDLLVPFSTHPALKLLFQEIATLRLKRLQAPADFLGVDGVPADAVEQIIATEAELRQWCAKHGVDYVRQPFSERACAILRSAGNLELICRLYHDDAVRHAEALLDMGRIDVCERLYGDRREVRFNILMRSGRFTEALTAATNRNDATDAYIQLGQPEQARVAFPDDSSLQARAYAYSKRDDIVLSDYPDELGWRARALLTLGRPAEALAVPQIEQPHVKVEALIALGRLDDALEATLHEPKDIRETCAWKTALAMLTVDDPRGVDLVHRLQALPDHFDEYERMCYRTFIPILLRVRPGVVQDLPAEFKPALDHRQMAGQTIWQEAALVSGLMDDAAYLACKHPSSSALLTFPHAVRADLAGDHDTATALYRQALEVTALDSFCKKIAVWRIEHGTSHP